MTPAKKKAEAPPEEPQMEIPEKVVQDEGTKAFQSVKTDDRIAQIESLIAEEIAETSDDGEGTFTHLHTIANAVAGYRDAQRSQDGRLNAPLPRGEARDEALRAELGAA